MKKYLLSALVVFLFGAATAFATDQYFADENDFPSWAKDSIHSMKKLGVINGYEDMTFKPNKPVTRAELATILSNYESYKEEEVSAALMKYASLSKLDLDEETKMALSLATGKKLELSEKPYLGDCTKVSSSGMPKYWTVYRCEVYGIASYYANFVYDGAVPESGSAEPGHFDQWYGPFDGFVGDIKSWF